MIQRILSHPYFNTVFSFLIGVGIVALIRPVCRDSLGQPTPCTIPKAPPVKEWDGAVYNLGSKCYEYKTKTVDCPKDKKDYIESFTSQFNARQSHLG
jgi:hypothetical protein